MMHGDWNNMMSMGIFGWIVAIELVIVLALAIAWLWRDLNKK